MIKTKCINIHFFYKSMVDIREEDGLQGFEILNNRLICYMKKDGIEWLAEFPFCNIKSFTHTPCTS